MESNYNALFQAYYRFVVENGCLSVLCMSIDSVSSDRTSNSTSVGFPGSIDTILPNGLNASGPSMLIRPHLVIYQAPAFFLGVRLRPYYYASLHQWPPTAYQLFLILLLPPINGRPHPRRLDAPGVETATCRTLSSIFTWKSGNNTSGE